MFHSSRPLPVPCDAPPYPIVRACHKIGVRSPEDVRWCRLRNARRAPAGRFDLLDPRTWKALLGIGDDAGGKCACGRALPALETYTFTLVSGRQRHYRIGQCGHCRSVYWEEP